MDYSALRSHTAQRVNELLSSPEAQRHLTTYGWTEGMPVVLAEPSELLEDVMGLVSVNGRAVLLALHEAHGDDLQLWHVTIPSPIFTRVAQLPPETTVGELCVRNPETRLIPFRVSFWAHSAAIHEIPCFIRTDTSYSRKSASANQ